MTHQHPTRAIYLHLLRSGDFLSAGDIERALDDVVALINIHATLAEMMRIGNLSRRGEPRHYRYGVTPTCRVPHGVTVGDIAAALAAVEAAC